MKRKILVTGTNMAIVKDFIMHSDPYFKALGCTDCLGDIKQHFKLYDPEAYIIFPEEATDDVVPLVNRIKNDIYYNKCPIFLCASVDACAAIQRTNPRFVDLMLKRPVSADNLCLRMVKYFDDLENARIEEEKAKSAEFVADEEVKSEESTENIINSKKHLLIVDDDRSILKMLKTALEDKYEITTMVNGVLVEKFLLTRKVDLVILDYEMPVKTGVDVLKDIRKIDTKGEIPICFLTGVAEREKIMEILSLKPNAYMLKPVNIESLIATISNLID